jgi:uncharacterized protein YecT (DUF1311 family)
MRYKTVSIMLEDYEALEKARQAWIKRHKAQISMPQFLKVASVAFMETL